MTFTTPATPTPSAGAAVPVVAGLVPANLAAALRNGTAIALVARRRRRIEFDRPNSRAPGGDVRAAHGIEVGHMLSNDQPTVDDVHVRPSRGPESGRQGTGKGEER